MARNAKGHRGGTRRFRRAVAAAWFACGVLPVRAEPVVYRVEPSLTSVEFSIVHLGVLRAHGRFTQVSGSIVYDRMVPAGAIDVDIASASVATGWSLRDAFIRGEAMFDAEHHPMVRFRSTHFDFAGGVLKRVDGDLTLHGVTRLVSLAVASIDCGAHLHAGRDGCDAEADGTIRRGDFNMDFAWPLIADDVHLRFRIRATRE